MLSDLNAAGKSIPRSGSTVTCLPSVGPSFRSILRRDVAVRRPSVSAERPTARESERLSLKARVVLPGVAAPLLPGVGVVLVLVLLKLSLLRIWSKSVGFWDVDGDEEGCCVWRVGGCVVVLFLLDGVEEEEEEEASEEKRRPIRAGRSCCWLL